MLDPSSLGLDPTVVAEARSLADLGVSDLAWPRSAALLVVRALIDTPLAIFGGDVLCLSEGHFKHTYDNWHLEPAPGEAFADYAVRTHAHTLEYLTRYPDNGHYYLLVVGTELPQPPA